VDQLVEDYLKYRNYRESYQAMKLERKASSEIRTTDSNNKDITDRIMHALEKCESLRLLTLWDTHIIQTLHVHPPETVAAARVAEFYLHLCCATHPFRDDTLRTINSPAEAAKYAARSMTVFKNFTETRGKRLLKTPEFQGFKNLHKIAFPPTHPTYSYMFRPEWQKMAKARVAAFLEAYFKEQQSPVLYSLLTKAAENQASAVATREEEIRSVFKKREEKLLDFSRSIYAISNDLLNAIDEGGEIDKDFLYRFRLKFDEFHEVLGSEPPRPSPGVRRKRRGRRGKKHGDKEPHFNDLDYSVISHELSSMVGEVETELASLSNPNKRLSCIDVEMAMQSAMQGSSIYNAMREFMTRERDDSAVPGDDGQLVSTPEGVTATRRNAARRFIEQDIFDLRHSGGLTRDHLASGDQLDRSNAAPASYVTTFLTAFSKNAASLCTHPYNKDMASPPMGQSVTGNMENHYGELFEASCALAFNMCRMLATISLTLPLKEIQEASEKNDLGPGLHAVYSCVADTLMSLPAVSEDHAIVDSARKLMLILLITLSHDRKHKLTAIKRGCVEWACKFIENRNSSADSPTTSDDGVLFLLCVCLVCCVVENPEARRAVVASKKTESACRSVLPALVTVIAGEDKIEVGPYQSTLRQLCLRFICALLTERAVREALFSEGGDMKESLQSALQPFLDDVEISKEHSLASDILSLVDGSADKSTCVFPSVTESADFMDNLFWHTLLNLPEDVHSMEYRESHPKESGLALLVNYTKSYIEEHGNLYEATGEDV